MCTSLYFAYELRATFAERHTALLTVQNFTTNNNVYFYIISSSRQNVLLSVGFVARFDDELSCKRRAATRDRFL